MTLITLLAVLNALLMMVAFGTSVYQHRLQANGMSPAEPQISKLKRISNTSFLAYLTVGLIYVGIYKNAETMVWVIGGLAVIFGLGYLWSKRASTYKKDKTLAHHKRLARFGTIALAILVLHALLAFVASWFGRG